MNAVEVDSLHKSFKNLDVLQGVNLQIPSGSIYALLGSNGAGKTTLVKILSTLLRADSGTAVVNDFDVSTHPQKVRASLTVTGQFAATDPVLTGRENLVLIARLRRLRQPQKVADALLEQFDLTEAGARRVGTYSGGMRRRLDIAMSLVGNPSLVILDEPTTGLDPQARIQTWQSIKRLKESGTTVLLTTQYLEEAEHLADRIAILHEGTIIQEGTLEDLRKVVPAPRVEQVIRQATLEDIFLSLVSSPTSQEEFSHEHSSTSRD